MKTLNFIDTDNLYFTSDLHFAHSNIIEHCNRPFRDVNEMNTALIINWNNTISKNDIVFILGDFCWKMGNKAEEFAKQLNGRKILILGNHDLGKIPSSFEKVVDGFLNMKVNDPDGTDGRETGTQRLTLCHYPMLSWYQSHRGAWQLFGHWHNTKVLDNKTEPEVSDYVKEEHLYMSRTRPTQYDVGVDGNNFAPVSYAKIKEIINKQKNEFQRL